MHVIMQPQSLCQSICTVAVSEQGIPGILPTEYQNTKGDWGLKVAIHRLPTINVYCHLEPLLDFHTKSPSNTDYYDLCDRYEAPIKMPLVSYTILCVYW